MTIEPKIAGVDETRCTGCLNCIEVCPFNAIQETSLDGKVLAHVVESLCQGCGNCCSACRVRAIEVKGFTDEQIHSQITAALETA